MKFTLILLCFMVFAHVVLGETGEEAWQKFNAKHRKGLRGGPAEATRKKAFLSRWQQVTEHNKKFANGQATFEVALGDDADVPMETLLKFKFGRLRNTGNATAVNPKIPKNMKGPIPASIDWVKAGIVTPAKHQGGCGSCYTFSTAAYLESQLLKARKTTSSIDLAEQQTVDCSQSYGNNGCRGGVEGNVFRYYQTVGQQLETTYPYAAKVESCRANKALGKISVTKVFNDQNVSKDYLKNLVATRGPVCVGIYGTGPLFQDYKSGIYTCSSCPRDLRNLNHAVLLVGYGSENGREYWLIKNSWGTNWGYNGIGKIDMANDLGVVTDVAYADWTAN